jgi:hypothetical protein
LLLDQCNEGLEVFQCDKLLLDKTALTGLVDLFQRLHEKLEKLEAREALEGSKSLENIGMSCTPKLLDYLISWAADSSYRSHALTWEITSSMPIAPVLTTRRCALIDATWIT